MFCVSLFSSLNQLRKPKNPFVLLVFAFACGLISATCGLANGQNNASLYEAPFQSATGLFEWDLFSGSASGIQLPDVNIQGGEAELSLTFTPDTNNGPPFPVVSATRNLYAAGSFPDYSASLTELEASGNFTTVVLQVAAVGDGFNNFQLNGIDPTELFNRGTFPGLVHGSGAAEFDTTFYWIEWQLEGNNRDELSLTFSSIPHVSLAGLRVDYVSGNSPVDAQPAGILSLRGDFDRDGDVDVDDLDQFSGQLNTDTNNQITPLDLNVDGTIDFEDFEEHYSQLVQIPGLGRGTFQGDLNLDGTVDVLGDAFQLVANLGNNVSSWSKGDFNGDGQVDVLGDAFALVENLGRSKATPQ